MYLYFIRHGATKGNKERRYIGKTDEGLTGETIVKLSAISKYFAGLEPQVKHVAVSPMKRCRQTADILFPGVSQTVIEDFRECDFGWFEYCSYEELKDKPEYRRFIDSKGRSGFPGGESRRHFQARCVAAFEEWIAKLVERYGADSNATAALVIHGGTIMALLDRYSNPHRDYYDWQAENGEGYLAELAEDKEKGGWQLVHIKSVKTQKNI